MEDQKRIISFKDANNIRFEITLRITYRNGYQEFTACGEHGNSCGQCQDSITPDNEYQEQLLEYWDLLHLQRCKDKYWEKISTICDDIETAEAEKRDSISISDLYDDSDISDFDLDEYDDHIIALAIHLELSISEIDDIEECTHGYGDCAYTCQGTDYYCGVESEMMTTVEEYMSESIWAFTPSFLGDYGSLYKMDCVDVETILKALQEQCDGANDAIKALVDWDENKEEMVNDAISADGFAHFLNSYDGNGHELVINNETYFICRM